MSIATEIQRLNTAKDNLRTSISAKGVEVPVDATLDTYSNYVDQISAGGGGYTVNLSGENCTLIGSGTYAEGSSVSIYCIPTSGYKFTSWSDGSRKNPRILTNSIDQNYTITATVEVDFDYSQEYFYVEDTSGSSNTLQITKSNSSAPTLTIYYSTNKSSWSSITTSTTSSSITIPASSKVYLRCTTNSWRVYSKGYNYYNKITCSGNYKVSGNIMSLLYGSSFIGQTTLPTSDTYTFYSLFYNSSTLTNASNLILPATTLTERCYSYMFNGCSSLTTAPELPATTLTEDCYEEMFYGCTRLTTPPSLPATTLTEFCYYGMFDGCSSLTTAPELPATTLASSCYDSMFSGCTALTTAPELPATTLASSCYMYMFNNCTSLTTAPELPATTLTKSCYYQMFRGCAFTTAPQLPATTLADFCYFQMFWNCTSLTTAPELPATTLNNKCYYRMFWNCTSLTTAPQLNATTLTDYCYYQMFNGCTSLNYIKCLATDISATDCTSDWVSSVASSGTFVKASNMTSWTTGTAGIPSGWTVKNI